MGFRSPDIHTGKWKRQEGKRLASRVVITTNERSGGKRLGNREEGDLTMNNAFGRVQEDPELAWCQRKVRRSKENLYFCWRVGHEGL